MSEIDWPGWSMCFSSAVVNGELRPAPSAATASGSVAKAMKVPEPVCTRPSPLAIDEAERFSDMRQLLFERIVAAGVEEDDVGLGAALELLHDARQRDQRNVDLGLVFDLRVDRHEIVLAIHLQAVAGIEEQRDVGLLGGPAELDQRLDQRAAVEVGAADHLEAERLEALRHVVGVVARIGELRREFIGRVADDQRNARSRRPGRCQPEQRKRRSAPDTCETRDQLPRPDRAASRSLRALRHRRNDCQFSGAIRPARSRLKTPGSGRTVENWRLGLWILRRHVIPAPLSIISSGEPQ